MKLCLPALLLASIATSGCAAVVAGAAAGYVVSQQVLPGGVHVSQVMFDVEQVWPSVKETMTFYQAPGTELVIQDFPRTIEASVNGAKVLVEVEADDLDLTTIRVTAEKYLMKNDTTAAEVMNGLLDRLRDL